jgi:hypothetical protein
VIGILLQLNQLGYAHFSWGALWPIVLIAAGGMAMWSALQARRLADGLNASSADPRTTLNENAIFGGVQKRVNAREFRGGQLQAMFGGIEIDMRDATLMAPKRCCTPTRYLAASNSAFRKPGMSPRRQGVFGGFTDSTRYTATADPDKPKKTLIVVGMAVCGGVEIRN